ncbi:sugar transferase [Qipengyuania sediminis]|uniref:sugar transferase n=1 Tax=Qipengyuania sediminis TaxID=1532023 RepID=UPI001059484A|nr:sugar transferase [Qipengyuania sediminis]
MEKFATKLLRYVVAWALVCLAPLVYLRYGENIVVSRDVAAINTTISSTIALILGLHISRQLFAFPGTRRLTQGLWAVFAGFVLVAAALLLLRIQYSVLLFAYSLGATAFLAVTWRGLFTSRTRNNFHLVPFGDVEQLNDLKDVTLVMMERPELPAARDASIVADLRSDLPPEWERMLAAAALHGIPVYHFRLLQESIAGKVKIEHLSENTLGSLIPDQSYKEIKWIADRIGALLLLPLVAPVLLAVAIIIKLQDGGSIFYNQRRVGLGGKPFTIYKFRSMTMRERGDGEVRDAAITQDKDKRITPFGSFIRRYRIDELPQIVNILKGEMSFIGPRPEAIPLAEWYDSELAFYSYRHIVRPGLSGWAQVNQGHVADLDAVDFKLQYDFFYIKYFSPWLDLLILLRTIRTILTGFGSR